MFLLAFLFASPFDSAESGIGVLSFSLLEKRLAKCFYCLVNGN